jgi:zinc protease
MIEFEKCELGNGLRVIAQRDTRTPVVAFNLLYNVGARDEDPAFTGFAHLFEHLMFEGSAHIPSYDEHVQMIGGENNAFTNNDITNYYLSLPAANIETAYWLESDRMLELAFSEHSLEIQKSVVIEEFRQRYLNQPYADAWLHLRPLAYQVHPYQWCTIGKDISHIQNATLDDVKNFFYTRYAPNNAILSVSGNVEPARVFELAEHWFGSIPRRAIPPRELPVEPLQTAERRLELERDVPYDAIYLAFHIGGRNSREFYACDMITDLLASGKSARLYQNLVKDKPLFSEVNAFVTGDLDPGLLVITGKLMEGIDLKDGENALLEELQSLQNMDLEEKEIRKVKNKFESNTVYAETLVLNRAMNLAFHELMGDAGTINLETSKYISITTSELQEITRKVFRNDNCSVLTYKSTNK